MFIDATRYANHFGKLYTITMSCTFIIVLVGNNITNAKCWLIHQIIALEMGILYLFSDFLRLWVYIIRLDDDFLI